MVVGCHRQGGRGRFGRRGDDVHEDIAPEEPTAFPLGGRRRWALCPRRGDRAAQEHKERA
jgi:hypothetical protein